MSEHDKTLLNEIKKYLVIGFLGIFLTASAALYLFYFKTGWEQQQMRSEINLLKSEKVDKATNVIQMESINDNLKDIKKDLKEHLNHHN